MLDLEKHLVCGNPVPSVCLNPASVHVNLPDGSHTHIHTHMLEFEENPCAVWNRKKQGCVILWSFLKQSQL